MKTFNLIDRIFSDIENQDLVLDIESELVSKDSWISCESRIGNCPIIGG
jgi:hypothetical protein